MGNICSTQRCLNNLLLSHFSHVQLCVTPETAAHQAPLSLGFSRQEHWSGLPFPSPMHGSEREVAQSCPTLCNPMDCSPPGSSIHAGSYNYEVPCIHMGFPGGLVGKESTCNAGDLDSIPGLGRPSGRGHGNPLLYSYLGESPWTEEPGRLQSMGPQSQTRLSTQPPWFLKVGRPASFPFLYK